MHSCFHVHSSRPFLLPGTLWAIPDQGPGSPGMLCPQQGQSHFTPLLQCPRSSTPNSSWEAPGSLSRAPNHLLSNGTPWWVIKPLQKCPGDPPALPWGPIHGPGFPQEAPSPRHSSWAAPGGAQRVNKQRKPKCASFQDFGWLWLGAGSGQCPHLVLGPARALIPHPKNTE